MTIIRSPRVQRDFTIISNSVCLDDRLSMRALGLLVRLLCRPDNWATNSEALAREFDCGREQMRGVLRELSAAGYMQLVKSRDDRGQWSTHWAVYDTPQTVAPEDGKPEPGNPYSGGLGAITSTDLTSTDNNTPIVPKGTKADGVKTNKERRKTLQTLSEYLASIPADGYAISPDDLVYERGIPADFINLAWMVFKDRFTTDPNHSDKRYKSWPSAFRQYIDGGFLRLWYSVDGVYQLTTAGQQAQARFAA